MSTVSSGLTLLRNANLYSPQFEGQKHLLVGGTHILAILDDVPHLDTNLLAEDRDLEGRMVVPGFIDSHVHITGGGGESGFASQVPRVPLSQFTTYGVTSVVGLLGTDDTTRTTGSVLARVYALREEGMSAWCWTGGYHYPLTTLTGSARKDIVYVEPVIGVGELAISDHRSSQPTLEEVLRVASEAYVAGLITGKAGIVHFHLGDGERKLELIEKALKQSELPARVFHPTHINRNKPLFEAACDLLQNHKGLYIDISAFPDSALEEGWSAAEALARAKASGCPLSHITISSDGGGCLPIFNANGEMLSMDVGRSETLIQTVVAALSNGVSLTEVLSSFTVNVARLLKLPRKGELRPGYDADLVVLTDDYAIEDVMVLGQWHFKHQQLKRKGTFE